MTPALLPHLTVLLFLALAGLLSRSHQTEMWAAAVSYSQCILITARYILTWHDDTQAESLYNMIFIFRRGRCSFACTILFFEALGQTHTHTHTHTLWNQHLCQLAAALIETHGLERSFNPYILRGQMCADAFSEHPTYPWFAAI